MPKRNSENEQLKVVEWDVVAFDKWREINNEVSMCSRWLMLQFSVSHILLRLEKWLDFTSIGQSTRVGGY